MAIAKVGISRNRLPLIGALVQPNINCARFLSQSKSLSVGASNTPKQVDTSDSQLSGTQQHYVLANIPFAHAKTGSYTLPEPVLGNQFTQDSVLKSYIKRHVAAQYLPAMVLDLERFGLRVAEELLELSVRMENEEPKLVQYTAWGKRVDELVTSLAWQRMKGIAAEEGLVANAYERQFGEWSRLHQFAKLYLFSPSGGLVDCPLAMTNGAAKTLELLKEDYPDIYNKAFPRLTSREASQFWTSGQWMTEKQGGSDVARGTETVAIEQKDGSYKLYGYKWFSSATDADMTLTLARVVGRDGTVVKGTKGLSLFFLETRDGDGKMNNIQMLKLKEKLGTRQMPTAELLLDGARAYKISDDGRGVPSIAHMLTLTRIHTGTSATAFMRRIINMSRDYATRRSVFGKTIYQQPLHVNTLAQMEIEIRAATLFMLEVSRLYGRQEMEPSREGARQEDDVLRLVVPLFKLYTSKQSVAVVSEGLESFGGQGYIEDTNIPRLLRDTQVNAIWEGTTNVLSLDVLRAIKKSSGSVLHHFHQDVKGRLEKAGNLESLAPAVEKLLTSCQIVLKQFSDMPQEFMEMSARDFAYSLARIYMGALLVDHASWDGAKEADVYAAVRWCERDLTPFCTNLRSRHYNSKAQEQNLSLVYQNYLLPERLA